MHLVQAVTATLATPVASVAQAGMAVGWGGVDGPQDEDPMFGRGLTHQRPARVLTASAAGGPGSRSPMAVAGLDPVLALVAGDEQASPGGRRWAVGGLAVGAGDADEAKAPSRSRVECLGVVGRGHGGGAAVRRASAKATDLANLPFDLLRRSAVWLELVLAAQDLTCWTQALLLNGALAVAEPKTLRYRLLHVAARIVRHARRLILRLQASWPWAVELACAFARLRALPLRC